MPKVFGFWILEFSRRFMKNEKERVLENFKKRKYKF